MVVVVDVSDIGVIVADCSCIVSRFCVLWRPFCG